MTIGMTLCSGIGAPEMAAPWVNWQLASEIERFPRAVLQERFGHRDARHARRGRRLWGDFTALKVRHMRRLAITLPDIVVAGTPCQAFSIAGLRDGTKDPRGNLTLKFVETCHAIVNARPDGRLAVLWENVPGVLSDKGNAFGCFLGGLVGASDAIPSPDGGTWPSAGMVSGPRARVAWRVLDAQYFGVAQRRRRVFAVIDFGGSCDPAAVLFERQGLRGNTPPRRETGQGVAQDVSPSLRAQSQASHRLDSEAYVACQANSGDVSYCLTASAQQSLDAETETLIAQAVTGDKTHALTAEGHDASEDGTGRGTPVVAFNCKGTQVQHDTIAPPLRSMGHKASHSNAGGHAAIAFAENQRGEVRTSASVPALSSGGGKPGQGYPAIAIQERAVSENPNAGPDGAGFRDDDAAYTLEARTTTQAVAFDLRGRDDGAQLEGPHDTANIRAASGGSSRSYVSTPQVRRLTPVECARLQGFPDDHTAITYRGKPAADGPQYKAYGNSMAVPCVRWIMDRLRVSMGARQ